MSEPSPSLVEADLYDPPLTNFGRNAVERFFTPEEIGDLLQLADPRDITYDEEGYPHGLTPGEVGRRRVGGYRSCAAGGGALDRRGAAGISEGRLEGDVTVQARACVARSSA